MGSLADELGGWDEEEGDENEYLDDEDGPEAGLERDSGIDIASSPLSEKSSRRRGTLTTGGMLSPQKTKANGHRRKASDYDGSEYGSESDFESTELVSATLEARLAAVEAMARRGLEENGSEGDKTIPRFTEGLKDLGGQTGMETGTTR